MRAIIIISAVAVVGRVASADAIVDNPGFCNASSGEQELADLVTLSPTSIDSHLYNCAWQMPLMYKPGLKTKVKAQCYDGASTFDSTLDVSVNGQSRITIVGDVSTGLPEYYFPCALWAPKS